MEPVPPPPPPKAGEWKISTLGDVSVAQQVVKDATGEEKSGLVGKMVVNINGEREKQKYSGSLMFDKQFMTTGDLKKLGLKAEWREGENVFSFSHNLSDTGNISSRIYSLTKLKDTKFDLNLKQGEYSFLLNISRTNNQNRSAGVLNQDVENKQNSLSIIKKGEKNEYRLIFSDVDNSSPLTGFSSSVKNLSLRAIQNLKGDAKISFGFESMSSDSRSSRTSALVSSKNKKLSVGLTTPVGEKCKFNVNFDSLHNSYSSQGRSLSTISNIIDYTLSYQIIPPLAWELNYNIYKTSGQSETRRFYNRLALTGAPKGYIRVGSSSLLYQLLSVEDRTGRKVSESSQTQLILPINIGTKSNFMGTITYGKQESAAGLTSVTTDMKNYNLMLDHRPSTNSRYFLQYNTNDTTTRGRPSNGIDNLRMGIELRAKAKGQQMPITLTRTTSSSSYGSQGSDIKETAINLGLPSSSPRTRLSYIFAITNSKTSAPGRITERDAKRHSLNVSLANKKGDLRLESLLSFIDTTEDLFNISLSLVYQKPDKYKISFVLFRNRECFFPGVPFDTKNLLLQFVYNF